MLFSGWCALSLNGPPLRIRSPGGGSTRITSAPRLASSNPQYPPIRPVRSSTRNPLSAPLESMGFESADMLISVSEFNRRADGPQYRGRGGHETRDGEVFIPNSAVGGRSRASSKPPGAKTMHYL